MTDKELKLLVEETIENLKRIKKFRIEERGILSDLLEDEIEITLSNMIDVLRFEYIIRRK